MMNAQDWQAAAEVLGVLLVLLNFVGGAFIYRMQAKFVTRAEHGAMAARVDEVEGDVADMKTTMAGLFTNDKASALAEKLNEVSRQNSQLLGAIPGLEKAISRLNHQVDMLVQNEIDQSRGKK